MWEDVPAEHIERHRADLVALPSEPAFVDAVARIPPLTDSDDRTWFEPQPWEDAYRLIAAADVVGERGWKAAVGPIYERAARGELYGLMQCIRHGPERAFADDLDAFASVLEPLTEHSRAGARQWSIRELGILRLARSLPALVRAVADPVGEVREEALLSLQMLAQRHPEAAEALGSME